MVHERHYGHHDFHYFVLFLVLATGFFAFANFVGIPQKQFQVAVVTAAAYVWWGVFHHYYLRDLHVKVVIEYTVVALLGLGLLQLLLTSLY